MFRPSNRPVVAFFDAIKNLRLRQAALVLKAGYEPNLLLNNRGQNGLQFLVQYFASGEPRFRLQVPTNRTNYLRLARLLLDSGLDADTPDLITGDSVLFDAIRLDERELVALLLNYADPALRNKEGETSLMCAARFGSRQVVRLLLDHLSQLELDGVFLRQRNRFGLTALELARAQNPEAARVITRHLVSIGQPPILVGRAGQSSGQQQLARIRRQPAATTAATTSLINMGLVEADLSDSPSDYESDLAGLYDGGRLGPRFDPKAAAFNQYLLEQQLGAGAGPMNRIGGSSSELAGDVEPDFEGHRPEEATGPGTADYFGLGRLSRSRSCAMLATGPSTSQSGGTGPAVKRAAGAARSRQSHHQASAGNN